MFRPNSRAHPKSSLNGRLFVYLVKMNKQWRISIRAYFKRISHHPITQILPTYLLKQIEEAVEPTGKYTKLPFMVFVRFMLVCLLWTPRIPSTRRLAKLSGNTLIQTFSGIKSVSHQALADRFQTVSSTGLRTLLNLLADSARRSSSKDLRRFGVLKLFDCTTVEGSAVFYDWAAPNGDKYALRFALIIDYQSDVPCGLQDASETTSDNSVFPKLLKQINQGDTTVWDAGFTKLVCFQDIRKKGAFWIARMANIYSVQVVHRRNIHPNDKKPINRWTLQQDDRVLVGTPDSGGPILARRLVWTNPAEEDPLVIWTNHGRWRPKRIFEAYQARWRVEVHFRWLKSELKIDHLPSHDPQGLENFFLLVLLAWLLLRLFSIWYSHQPWSEFSCRDAVLDFQNSLIEGLIDRIVALTTDS